MGKIAKVPVIIQLEALECGAACLCMIAAYYKKWIPLTQVRADCGVSRDGSVAKNILKAGRAYGFEAGGYRLEPSTIDSLSLPAIIHWDFNHFVVLCGVDQKKGKVYINDPGSGKRVLTMEEFDRSFTGIALSFVPGQDFKPEGKPKSVISFAKKALKGAMVPFILAFLITFVLKVVDMASPIFNKIFLDDILSKRNPEWLIPFIGIMFLVLAVQVLIGIIQSIYWLKIEGKFAISSSAEFMWHVLRLPLDFFSQRYIGDIVSRQESTGQIALTLIKKISPIFIDIVSLFLYLIVMIKFSWQLTLIGITATLINMFIAQYTSKKMLEFQRAAVPNSGKLMSVTYSGIEMIETIKSTGAESGYFERWAGYYARQNNAAVNITKFSQYVGTIPNFVQSIADITLLMCGIYLIMQGHFTIGTLTAFQGYLGRFFGPVCTLMEIYKSFVSMRCDMERVEDVLEYPTDVKAISSTEEKSDEKLQGNLQLKNITFGYSKLAEPLLKDFSLNLTPGAWVALVGGSGSGKSTIAKLIMGLYKPWHGEITFDGKTKDKIDDYKFHSSISMVDQEKVMFNDTVKNNIKMWDDSIEDFAVTLASRDADIHETIISRHEGYNHVIREGGKDFSGGQCQRIEIARVLAQEPTIIILDEATSALDAKTEETVMNNIRTMGCTCVVVAHRLSTIRDCDEIIVLDQGNVVERGRHEELMEKNGLYTRLVTTE
ncbi:MAG: NHLP family bacteriocin export ABC transporter peptidase/permease/ATPase subunit [Oscillospiraceae bacterium]|jgi:NHLM bacteriocin system ABC transporter peptidase/ATP-binding protein|nr:NHLP family bacteriocin export ABC transporter peptidase/permease/ATPase subunit [Oscillospiraceae bacterium]